MSKIARSFIVVLSILVTSFSTFAEEVTKKFEIGTFSNNSSVSSSPVSGFSANGRLGLSAKFIVSNLPNFDRNVEAVIGASFGSTKLGLAGTNLGNVDSDTIAGGIRYRFSNDQVQPYVGVGVHFTSLDGSLANNTLRVSQPKSGLGTYLEAGIRGTFPKNDFWNGYWNLGVQSVSKTPFSLMTTAGAKMSDVSTGETRFEISIGGNF
ncbi:outer membrane beta-barrel protein [Candidatus Gracilibacteria bacterium]|nr:outer membrane beta-barrel protein [Candidatus Gracilibacteria bacterium]MCF7898714.1 outer membrane beta-barrel protein [Candidatus Paceibacterota bacterium]